MYHYKAIANGTLANPYRFVRKGQRVSSEVEIKSTWLKAIIDGKEPVIEELPITPYIDDVSKRQKPELPVQVFTDAYSEQMNAIQKLEAIQDGEEGAEASSPSGSGDQDVI